jgi:hypothetical protein
MVRRILIAEDDGTQQQLLELAGLLTDSVDGDEIVVENATLAQKAQDTWHRGLEPGMLKIMVDPDAVKAERDRIRQENASRVLADRRRMTGPGRASHHIDVTRLPEHLRPAVEAPEGQE